jgi:hypothetical protein
MKCTMMGAAERDRKLVADSAPQSAWLHEPQMMWVRRPPSAHQARLRGNELQVLSVAVAARFTQGECAFIDVPGYGIVHPLFPLHSCGSRLTPHSSPVSVPRTQVSVADHQLARRRRRAARLALRLPARSPGAPRREAHRTAPGGMAADRVARG